MCTKTPRKHAELIKAWAEGATIEWRSSYDDKWESIGIPSWLDKFEYRVKPEPKPDIVLYGMLALDEQLGAFPYARLQHIGLTPRKIQTDTIKVIFDGETGKLKAVEIL